MAAEELRARLRLMHADAMRALLAADVPEPGHLTLLAGIEAGLRAVADDGESAGRAVVTDDGSEIRLTLYEAGERIGGAALDPVRAIAVAGKLIAAALRHLHER